jgi:hypothetical protein
MASTGNFFSSYQNTYTSIPGTQIKVIWGKREMGTIQGITVSISAEKSPIFVMGFQTCRGYTTNKIGIAGSAVFLNIDRDALYDQRIATENKIVSASRAAFTSKVPTKVPEITELTAGANADGTAKSIALDAEISADTSAALAMRKSKKEGDLFKVHPTYAAQLKEFDVVLTGMDFQGRGAFKAIRGVELINEGFATSVDDTILESQYTFVAREVTPWVPLGDSITMKGAAGEIAGEEPPAGSDGEDSGGQ